ncbi:hypothetical protein FRB97_004238 [Tulasnella sp. 331]|nr:hypothetical protein FRB97_004238 [Tulasnella sp. 331]KAG8887650.1 hypothetical protein FRB98_009265 [Tulasnella sp. 332]
MADIEKIQPERITPSDKSDDGQAAPGSELPTLSKYQAAAQDIDPIIEKRVMRKVDWRLMPILGFLMAFSIIDRNSLEFISNIMIRWAGVKVFLTVTTFLWGLVYVCSGFSKNWQTLAALRALLGIFEAGFQPASIYILGVWYTRNEVMTRLGVYYSFSLVLGGFSAILATGFTKMEGLGGVAGWSWIFIMEGLLTIILSFGAWFLLIDFPDRNNFLSAEETKIVLARIDADRGDATYDALTWSKIVKYTFEAKLWGFAILFFCACMPSYALSTFLPVILGSMGWGVTKTELMVAPPFLVALIVMLICSRLSDHYRLRAPFIIFASIVCLIGFLMVAWCEGNGVRYTGAFLGFSGASANVVGTIAYQNNNLVGQSKRSYSAALTSTLSGISGIVATTVFRQQDFPRYRPGAIATVVTQIIAIFIVVVMTVAFHMKNRAVRNGTAKAPIEGTEGFFYTL